jgi:hypothetical protein
MKPLEMDIISTIRGRQGENFVSEMATAVVTGHGAENERPNPASSSNADYASDGGSAAERNGKASFQLASGSFEESVSELS